MFFFGCSPKTLFPTDNKKYDSIGNYDYNYENHIFLSYDKTPLHGLYIKSTKTSKGLLVVVNGLHENVSKRFKEWLWMVDNDYDVFIFDYRGYGESNADVDIYGFRDDVNSAIEYAHNLDKEKKITLIGQSMGGSFAIDALAIKKYEYINLIVSDSTFTGFDSILSEYMLKSIIFFPIAWLPYTFTPKDLNSINNIEYLDVPILYVTGDSDWIVNDENSKVLYEKTKVKTSLWIIKDAGHVKSFRNENVRRRFLELLEQKEFFHVKEINYF